MFSNDRRRTRGIRSALQRALALYLFFIRLLREIVVFPSSFFVVTGDPIRCGPIVDTARYATCLCREECNGTLEHLKVAHLPAAVGREKFRVRVCLPDTLAKSISCRDVFGSSLVLCHSDEFDALHGR